MNVVGRPLRWVKRHLRPSDLMLFGFVALTLISLSPSMEPGYPGLLRNARGGIVTFWSCLPIITLCTRRRFPQSSALCFAAIVIVQQIFGPSFVMSDSLALVLLFTIIVYGDPSHTRTFIALAFVIAFVTSATNVWATNVGAIIDRGHPYGIPIHNSCSAFYVSGMTPDCSKSLLQSWAVVFMLIACSLVACIVMAYWQRARIRTVRILRERNASIEAREEEERHIAALAERARIARDMHDMVAHTLSIIIVQSDGGRYAALRNPQLAKRTMRTIRHETERALSNMGTLLSTFDDEDAGYEAIDRLVEDARTSSPDNTIVRSVHGSPNPQALGTEATMAAVRVVQESLTNIRKYAGPNVTVDIRESWDTGGLLLSVQDNGCGAKSTKDGHAPGFGLMGMHERIDAVHGTISAGPCERGGFLVSVDIPYATDRADHEEPVMRPSMPSMPSASSTSSTTPTTASPDRSPMPPMGSPPVRDDSNDASVAPLRDRLRSAIQRYRSVPLQTNVDTADGNWVERLSRWFQRHYLAVDTASTLALVSVLILVNLLAGPTLITIQPNGTSQVPRIIEILCNVLAVSPLALRRRAPELSAACIAVVSAFQLFLFGIVTTGNLFVLISLYSVIMYGRPQARRWVVPTMLVDCMLLATSFIARGLGFSSILSMMTFSHQSPHYPWAWSETLLLAAFVGGIVLFLCISTIGLALWTRSRGSNALVLRLREEALREERDKQRILAANLERNRIGASIQTEVNTTLSHVLTQADSGLHMLTEYENRHETPPPDDIAMAFERIGRQGRAALTHMRRLLGMLRETGVSDADGAVNPDPVLHPVPAMKDGDAGTYTTSHDHDVPTQDRPQPDVQPMP